MSDKSQKLSVLSQLKQTSTPLSLPEISSLVADAVNERTLRRWLVAWVESSILERTGKKRGTRYSYNSDKNIKAVDSLINSEQQKSTPLFFCIL